MRRYLGLKAAEKPPDHDFKELQALEDAIRSASLIMNDEMDEAETELLKGSSPFHKLGLALAVFLRAVLGLEKETMDQARAKLSHVEEISREYQLKAQQNSTAYFRSEIYPAGSLYALCHAEALLMSAVLGVLSESVTESVKGFFKLRKAYNILYGIREAEKGYVKARSKSVGDAKSDQNAAQSISPKEKPIDHDVVANGARKSSDMNSKNGTADLALLESSVKEQIPETSPSDSTADQSSPNRPPTVGRSPSTATTGTMVTIGSERRASFTDFDIHSYTSNPVDIYIHAGTGLCFGLLQLILSMIPPALTRIINLFSYRGDRAEALRLLWTATQFKSNINGAMAGLVLLFYYDSALKFCDILIRDEIPQTRLHKLMQDMREVYPKSKLWTMEEAKMLAANKKPEEAIDLIANGPLSPLRQVEAFGKFETGMYLMYLHQYERCAASFIECSTLNTWSPALYYYIAGSAYVELYRTNKSSSPEKAEEYAKTAEKHLREVLVHTKKKFLRFQLPIDAFVERKIKKWEHRATKRGCRFIDAVGVSPIVEMTYFWSGFWRMRPEQLHNCQERLAWSDDLTENPSWASEAEDEKVVLAFLRGVCEKFLGELASAEKTFTEDVTSVPLQRLKACEFADSWPLPIAHYELAVCTWRSSGEQRAKKEDLVKCSERLSKIEKWESFEMEARVGIKVATARQTLKKCGINSP